MTFNGNSPNDRKKEDRDYKKGGSNLSYYADGICLFQLQEGYGKGCPWSCPFYGKDVAYNADDYPETNKLLSESFVICSEKYPIYAQDLDLMKYYVEGFHKVFENLDKVIA